MIKHFLFVWGVYWLLVMVLPVASVYPSVISAFFLQLVFVNLVLAGYGWFLLASNAARPPEWEKYQPKNLTSMIRIAIWLSLIGTACLLYDKIFVQDIDYTKGIAVAREAWRKEGEERSGGISSMFSVIGYLLSSGYYVAAVLLVLGGKRLDKNTLYKSIFLVFGLLVVNSVIAGGRSNVLLLAVFIFGTTVSVTGWSYKRWLKSKFLRLFVLFFISVSLWYLLYVFSERAKATGVDVHYYLKGFLPYLGLKLSPEVARHLGGDVFSNMASLLLLAASYISHSFATTAAIIDHGPGDKIIIFLHPMNILHKINIIGQPDGSWFLAGRFPSLPGSLFYQYGVLGFSVLSLMLGFLAGIAKFLYIRRPSSVVLLSIYLAVYSILVLSPLLLAVDFMSFPFVLWSFLLVGLLTKLNSKFRFSFKL